MTYLLDTDTLSQFSRGHANVLERLKETSPSAIAISSVTLMEIEYGLALQTTKAHQLRPVLEAFLRLLLFCLTTTTMPKQRRPFVLL